MASHIIKDSPLALDAIERLLLIQSGDIGDVVLSIPCVSALRRRFPQCKIAVAVRKKAKELMDDCPLIDQVLVVDRTAAVGWRKWISIARQIRLLRKARFDLAIDLRTGTRGAIMARVCGAPQRISFYARNEVFWRNWMFTHLAEIPPVAGMYMVDYYHFLLKVFDISDRPGQLRLWVNPERQERLDSRCREMGFDPSLPFIALQPYSLWAHKDLPDEHYIRLIELVHSSFRTPVVIIGGPDDQPRAAALCCRANHAINMAGRTTIGELPALLARSLLFIGIDSAGLHIAAAVGCPTIGIFGPSASESWAPRGNKHLVLQAQEACSPCRNKGCHNSEQSLCLQRMSVLRILDALENRLKFTPEIDDAIFNKPPAESKSARYKEDVEIFRHSNNKKGH